MPRPLSGSLDKVARDAVGKDWDLYATLIERWRDIVGKDYASQTSPVKIIFPRGKAPQEKWASPQRTGGTLTVRLPQGLAFEFSHKTDIFLNRINSFFGYDALAKIVFEPCYTGQEAIKKVQAPPAPPPLSAQEQKGLENALNNIENNELKDALQRLGASIIAEQKKV